MENPGHLPRLRPEAYRGRAWIHWTMTVRDRGSGWLDEQMHAAFREFLLHTGCRYQLHCPAYCLMPDHAHVLWMGVDVKADQLLATRFFRRHWNGLLEPYGVKLQPQPHDRVLRDDERAPGSFEDTVLYIRKNPERAGLVVDWKDWRYGGAMVPGYPDLPLCPASEFWGKFWKIHHREVRRCHRSEGDGESGKC